MDRLPVEVIHRILSFVPYSEDAVRTSVLSKTWLEAWSTNPRLNFCQRRFGEKLLEEDFYEKFVKFVGTTLQRRSKHSPGIVKFKLFISVDKRMASLVDKWLRLVVVNGVRKLSINLVSTISTPWIYILRQSSFDSCSLTSLKVRGSVVINFCVGDDDVKKCCSLKKLHLWRVSIDESTIRRLSSVFPLIEELKLMQPYSHRDIVISNLPNLKKFYVSSSVDANVEISQPHSLESFTYEGSTCASGLYPTYINIFHCQNLTYLNLSYCSIADMCFHNLLSQCPVLEYLVLDCCRSLQRVIVSSHSLKYLKFSGGLELEDVKIDAPNLTELDYDTRVVPSFSLKSLYHDLEATVHIDCCIGIGTSFFIKLEELATQISLSQIFLTLLRSCNNISFNIEEVRKVPLLLDQKPKLENLELKIESPLIVCSALLDGLLWSFCLQNLTVSYKYDPEPTEFLCNELMNRSRSCCSSREVKCWRHYLKQVDVVFYEKSGEDEQMLPQQLDWKSMVDGSITPKGHLKIRFSFHW